VFKGGDLPLLCNAIYHAQREIVVLPLCCTARMHAVKIVFLARAVHVEGQALESAGGDFTTSRSES
jgi:hypothetical protein